MDKISGEFKTWTQDCVHTTKKYLSSESLLHIIMKSNPTKIFLNYIKNFTTVCPINLEALNLFALRQLDRSNEKISAYYPYRLEKKKALTSCENKTM